MEVLEVNGFVEEKYRNKGKIILKSESELRFPKIK